MTLTTQFHRQLDIPAWEMTAFAPQVSQAGSVSCVAQNGNFNTQHGRFIYYLINSTSFYRYDTWTDTFVQLASPPAAVATWATMRFLQSYGVEGRVLAAAAGSVTIPGYFGQVLQGYDISIVSGTGAGQRRVISKVADAVAADSGVVTSATGISLTDSTKSWGINQWAGYQVRVIYGTGISQVRRILYNDATGLFWGSTTKYAEDAFCNPANPSPTLTASAGSQSIYQIESSVASVDQNWTVTPDITSRFRVASGAIQLLSAGVLNQWYDVAQDLWYTKSVPTNVVGSGTVTDGTLETMDEASVMWDRGTASSGTTTTLVDSLKSWTVNQWVGYWVWVAYGTAAGQIKKVTANTANTLTFSTGTAPDTTSAYFILGYDAGTATAGGASTLTDSAQSWATNRWKNYCVRILSGTGAGQVLPIASNTSTAITTVRAWSTQPDSTSVYVITVNGDQSQFMVGNQAAVFCYGVEDDMVYQGRLSESGVARRSSVQFGSFKPQAISTLTKSGTTATATTVNAINFPTGSTVTIAGATGVDASLYNITTTVTVTSTTTFTYTMAGTPTADANMGNLATTQLSDSSKNWTTNQWAGYLCHMANTIGAAPTGQTALIASNTANTLTFAVAAAAAPVNGTTRYVLTPNAVPGALVSGVATGTHSTTTLQDTNQNWVTNIWAGRRLKISGGTDEGQETPIVSNTSTTLTFGGLTQAPVSGSTTYSILGQPARGAGIEMRHAFGTSDTANKGKYLFVNRGGGALGFDRLNLTTDTFEMMVTQPQTETLTTGSMFAYDGGDRLYFQKDATNRLFYMNIPTNHVNGGGVVPYQTGTAIVGNRMDIFTTGDGLKFLWVNRHANLENFRCLLFW